MKTAVLTGYFNLNNLEKICI